MSAVQAALQNLDLDSLLNENAFLKAYLKRHDVRGDHNEDKNLGPNNMDNPNLFRFHDKLVFARKFLNELTQERYQKKESSEKEIAQLQIMLEELEICILDLQRDAHEFRRDVLDNANQNRSERKGKQVSVADKLIKYMENKSVQKKNQLQKYGRKIHSLQIQKKKLETQLNKNGQGRALHYINIHQLQIKNKQHTSEIHKQSQELFQLKLNYSLETKRLDDLRHNLSQSEDKIRANSNNLIARKTYQRKIRNDVEHVKLHYQSEKEKNKKYLERSSKIKSSDIHKMPNIEEYMKKKNEMYLLQKEIKSYERKIEIMQRGKRRKESSD